jgi:hypothetical protein
MANLITYEYFKGVVNVPNSANANDPAKAEINQAIKDYEGLILTEILGYELHKLMMVDVNATPYNFLIKGAEFFSGANNDVLEKWQGLANDAKDSSLIANFVYYKLLAHRSPVLTGIGSVNPLSDSGEVVIPTIQLVNTWNRMVDLVVIMDNYINYFAADFPTYLGFKQNPFTGNGPNKKYFQKINQFGI